jgi:hypothetical protein
MKWYEGSLSDTEGCEAAYQLTETTWIAEYGDRMYKNYQSFRACRHFYMKYTKKNTVRH